MSPEDRAEFMEGVQKDLTSSCFRTCFRAPTRSVDRPCFDACYEKYINTTQTVSEELKRLAYQNQSLYGYKVYPEVNVWTDIIYSRLFTFMRMRQDIYIEYHPGKNVGR
eukprot:TRINITY_DN6849_c0_g2_i1.p1 TRINITY_DN6849_c0_g2~~TRINITY_DN6849_c0_g2_i1.p1  ORF type:complete len:109 (-),score=8.92 TRINITY_DN6849_c0_g2_i1:33-359(-)